jgi:hypothetical protein
MGYQPKKIKPRSNPLHHFPSLRRGLVKFYHLSSLSSSGLTQTSNGFIWGLWVGSTAQGLRNGGIEGILFYHDSTHQSI